MSSTRTINGITYVIPPGTEDVWTPPAEALVTPPPEEASVEELVEQLGCHILVREQSPEVVTQLITELRNIWSRFKSNQVNSEGLSAELASFRLNRLCDNDGYDQVTVEVIENVMVRMMQESTKL
jgi:hypothetical protein